MAGRVFHRAPAHRSADAKYERLPAYLVLGLVVACGSSKASSEPPRSDGGILINVPDAAVECDGAAPAASNPPPVSTCVPVRRQDFTKDVLPIFGSCSGEICHEFTAAGLKASIGVAAYECCTETPLIAPGFPEASYLLDKVRGTKLCGGVRMPVDKPPLGDADIQTISDWICEGAPTE
jgi:hypothetical protein